MFARKFAHLTFYVLPPLLQVFLEAESVVVAHLSPEVVVLVVQPEVASAAAELSPEVVVLAAEPEVSALVFVAAEPEVSALVFVAAEPEVVFVSEPQASVDIAVAFVVLVPVSVVVVEVDSSGRPKFLAFPNVDHFASFSSSVEVVG
jgi:hypothetical protein